MFDSQHYIPILKWKPAEQQALEKLTGDRKKFVSPLIQIVMPNPKQTKKGQKDKSSAELLQESLASLKTKLPMIPEEILRVWGTDSIFVDLSLIHGSLREEGFSKILSTGSKMGLTLIPVVRINSDDSTHSTAISIAKENKSGICLRLFRSDFMNQIPLGDVIKKFLKANSLFEHEIDLCVDFQITDERCRNVEEYSKRIPILSKWRTFTFASGSFPVDLTGCKLGKNNIPRSDYINWINHIQSRTILRKPSFGDYTIQHPIYKAYTQSFSPSASIRYTLADNWLVMRGQKGKNKQYLANAQLLSNEPEFFGERFSHGDAYIVKKGIDLKSEQTGNATTWLMAGINHHLSCTADQISTLT